MTSRPEDVDRSGAADLADLNAVNGSWGSGGLDEGELSDPDEDNIIGFSGYLFNKETRHYHVRFRVYDTGLGRWLERDPLRYVDGMNLYQYVRGGPLGAMDPYGLCSTAGDGGGGETGPPSSPWGWTSHGAGSSGGGGGVFAIDVTDFLPKINPNWNGRRGMFNHSPTSEYWRLFKEGWDYIGGGIHTTLDVVGVIPGIGFFADGANAIIYLLEGDFGNAALRVAFMVPIGGSFLAAGKIGMTVGKGLRGVGSGAGKLIGAGTKAGRVIISGAKSTGGRVICYVTNKGCFLAGTLVLTSQGLVPIEDVQPGDQVWSYNHETGEWELCVVEGTRERWFEGEIVTVVYTTEDGDTSQIEATDNHPFWVETGTGLASRPLSEELSYDEATFATPSGSRWIDAKWLRVGDAFLTKGGRSATVTGLTIRTERVPVYNLHVARHNNYAVGDVPVLVHNYRLRNRTIIATLDGSFDLAYKWFTDGAQYVKQIVEKQTGEVVGELWIKNGEKRVIRWPHKDPGTPDWHFNLEDWDLGINWHVIIRE